MKKIFLLFVIFIAINSCSKPSQCVESTGANITKSFDGSFEKVTAYKGIELIISQGAQCKVLVQTGENLMSNIEVSFADNMLTLKDNTTCNWVREYGQTKVFITAPNITDIICKTERNISSNGVLTFPILRLNSMDLSDGAGTGDFNLQINNSQVVIENNNISNYYISGQTDNLMVNFYEGNGRLQADAFHANTIKIFHRGSNDLILFPITSIQGDIYSTGNVICKNHPTETPQVVAHYHGQLYFQ